MDNNKNLDGFEPLVHSLEDVEPNVDAPISSISSSYNSDNSLETKKNDDVIKGFDPETFDSKTELFSDSDGKIWDSESSYREFTKAQIVSNETRRDYNKLDFDRDEPMDMEGVEIKHLM